MKMVYQFMTRVKPTKFSAELPDVTDTSAFSKMYFSFSRPFLLEEVSRRENTRGTLSHWIE